jgi:hypothetical protein
MTRLADLEPPPDRTPGYYPDPLGGKFQRWWDGDAWISQVGPEASDEAEEAKNIWWVLQHYGALTVVVVVVFLVETNLLTEMAIALAAGFLAQGLIVLLFRLRPDLRPDPERFGRPTWR